MALYGASVGVNGLREAAELRERRHLVLSSKTLDRSRPRRAPRAALPRPAPRAGLTRGAAGRFATAKLALIEQVPPPRPVPMIYGIR